MEADLAPIHDSDVLEKPEEERPLRCVFCDAEITDERHSVEKAGSWKHVFTNPAGYVYEIGCYGSAPGCAILGDYVSDFSWFKKYYWAYAVCGSCYHHVGWHFSGASGSDFYGLILKYLK